MPSVKKKFGKNLLNELSELRYEAIDRSYYEGKRRTLGRLSIGDKIALWRSEEGGESTLIDKGLRLGEAYIPPLLYSRREVPTTSLFIHDDYEEDDENVMMRQFFMDLNPEDGFIDALSHLVPTSIEAYKEERDKRSKGRKQAQKMGLAMPNEEELALLRSELQRGASGAFELRSIVEGYSND